ncbi:DNA-binding response OmpR family regulator [Desulfitobacterium sp. LBE]|uniref:response regulator transcription factor n=1 Tax=Desulfitobacterium sp. LBE TaxID=884086 RepID=UPI00119A7A0C|nr:response regulator transcription factor [Desulfitobacterium sp. LBE]TWH56039.1 DNA-binding response OmpR family regulator [Desulfitobacterium sp. LBE]
METKKRIYIADDEENIREAIKTFLMSDGYEVTAFANGDLLLGHFKKDPADLVILDIMMPGSNGFTVCSEIRKLSTVPIIMLTARDSDLDYATGLSLGSDDYFTKPFSAMSLVMRVKAIFRRIEFEKQNCGQTDDSRQLSFGDIAIDTKGKTVKASGQELMLTPNEYDLLKYLIERNDQAVSRDELLESIWGYNTEIETRATDDTVRRLRKKLEQSNVLIEAVWGFGFRLKVHDANG